MADILNIHATIDEMLADFPPAARMRASADIMSALLRMKRDADAEITAREAAQLLPDKGAEAVATRQNCHRSTVYRRVSRAAKVARQIHSATKPA